MTPGEVRRQQLIHSAMASSPDDVSGVAIELWQSLASQLVSIIGEGGFNSRWARSLHLTHKVFPWLPPDDALRPDDFQFTDLKLGLAKQSAVEANNANCVLLQTFTNLLASLIGEPLTVTVLSSAWADSDSERDIAGKELPHD